MNNRALRALVVQAILSRKPTAWRQHGIGVLQAYLVEDRNPEVRIHIWSPALVRPGIREAGSIHDHRFDLESTVVFGSLIENVYVPMTNIDIPEGGTSWSFPPAKMRTWTVQNARAAGAERGFDGVCAPTDDVQRYACVGRDHHAGSTYRLGRGVFHETIVRNLAITVCTMHEKRGQAHLLVPDGQDPVHAFGTPVISDVSVAALLVEARDALESV